MFLYVPFNGVHSPYQVPDRYSQRYPQFKGQRQTYAGMVTAMDDAVGEITAALKAAGILDNTLVLFSSDNGGPAPKRITSNGPLRARQGDRLRRGCPGARFAAWPGHIPAGSSVQTPIHISDWYPTLLKVAGRVRDTAAPR